jgi:hypothetical protein
MELEAMGGQEIVVSRHAPGYLDQPILGQEGEEEA